MTAPPCVAVIFGATGDLARRKLYPALYNLRKENLLPDEFVRIENGRSELGRAEGQERDGVHRRDDEDQGAEDAHEASERSRSG